MKVGRMSRGVMRRFHFLVLALVICVVGYGSFSTGGAGAGIEIKEQAQTGRYIYSAEGNSSSIANHCGGLAFSECCQYERDNLPGLFIFIYAVALLYVFLAVAIICDDYFVPSLELISERLDLSEDVAGATFMAAGSSAPELFTSLASVTSESDVGVGTIVGSAVFNILVIISLTAALTKTDLHLDWRPLVRDSVFYGISIVMFCLFVLDGEVQWYESIVLLVLYALYIVVMKFNQGLLRQMTKFQNLVTKKRVDPTDTEAVADDNNKAEQPVVTTGQLPAAKQGFTEDVEMEKIKKSNSDNKSRSSKNNVLGSSQKNIDGDEKVHFKHHKEKDEKVRNSLIRRASEIGNITVGNVVDKLEKTETNLSDFIEEADDSEVQEIAYNTEKKNHSSVLWMLFSGIYLVEKPEKSDDKKGMIASLLYGYEWVMYCLSVPLYFLMSHTVPQCSRKSMSKYYILSFVMSIVWIACLTICMVILVEKMGCILGISLFLMGLFLVAAGTSIPDAMSSILVARDGFADMAVSNAIGSNIFDINLGLGFPFLVKAIIQAATGQKATVNLLTKSERTRYDAAASAGTFYMVPHVHFGLILLGILVVTLFTFMVFKFRLSRQLGVSFFCVYIAFVIYGLVKEFVCYDGSGISC